MPRQGMATGDNDRFIRYWYEVNYSKIGFHQTGPNDYLYEYYPYSKGGMFRKWYGNNLYIIKFGKAYRAILSNQGNHMPSRRFYFKPGLTWSSISSGKIAFRYNDEGMLFDQKGPVIFTEPEKPVSLFTIMGYLNSRVATYFLTVFAPTLDFSQGPVKKLPIIKAEDSIVDRICVENIKMSQTDWNISEESWNFSMQLLRSIAEHNRNWTVEAAFNQWKQEAQDRFDQLKKNEEELNKIFIDLYGLQDELSPEESDKEVSVRKADLGRDIRAFMSYFIGVTFGRYSLDTPGLAFAGGDWDSSKYTSYQPNADDVIVLTDSDYFGDDRDIMHRFREFLTVTFGKEHLEENLTFIAKALGKAGDTAEDQIRSYLFNDFYKNHLTIYQKRPIYWQLDSGRQGGFKALMYLHRYDGDTMAMIRTSYLHTLQAAYEKRVTTLDTFIASETNTRQKNQLIKQRDHTRKQLEELVKYDAQLQHVANMHIAIDLDDGVVVNHQKVQADVKLLTPIK